MSVPTNIDYGSWEEENSSQAHCEHCFFGNSDCICGDFENHNLRFDDDDDFDDDFDFNIDDVFIRL